MCILFIAVFLRELNFSNTAKQFNGSVAHLEERLICIQEVASSILVGSTNYLLKCEAKRWLSSSVG